MPGRKGMRRGLRLTAAERQAVEDEAQALADASTLPKLLALRMGRQAAMLSVRIDRADDRALRGLIAARKDLMDQLGVTASEIRMSGRGAEKDLMAEMVAAVEKAERDREQRQKEDGDGAAAQ